MASIAMTPRSRMKKAADFSIDRYQGDTALLLLFRHGETDWNAQGKFQGHIDIPLNALGFEQAKRIARALSGHRIEAILSSDLQRALETAEAASAELRLPITQDARLREAHIGLAQGLTYEEMEIRFGRDTLKRWRSNNPHDHGIAFPDGETGGQVLKRASDAIWHFLEHAQARRIGVSTHGGVLRRLVARANEVPGLLPPISNGLVYAIEADLKSKTMKSLNFLLYR